MPPWVYFPPTAATAPTRRADAVTIFTETLRAWGKDLLAYLGAFLLAGLATAAINVGVFWYLLGIPWPTTQALLTLPARLGPDFAATYALMSIGVGLVGTAITAWFTAVVTYFAIGRRRGRTVRWSEAAREGTRCFPSVLGGTLVVNGVLVVAVSLDAAVSLGSAQNPFSTSLLAAECGILLLFPLFLFLWIALLLYAPAAVMERLGAVASLRRSWTLTRGRRGSIFGALILLGLIALVVEVFGVFVPILLGSPLASFLGQVATTMIIGGWQVLIAAVAYELIGEEQRELQARQAFFRPAVPPS